MKFRKKTKIVEAHQFTGQEPWPDGVFRDSTASGAARPFVVTTHKQYVYLEPGDWVVPEPDGNGYYPIKDAIFQEDYAPVEVVPLKSDEPEPDAIKLFVDLSKFEKKVAALINEHSLENHSNTPDFILAKFLSNALYLFDKTMQRRDLWFKPSAPGDVAKPDTATIPLPPRDDVTFESDPLPAGTEEKYAGMSREFLVRSQHELTKIFDFCHAAGFETEPIENEATQIGSQIVRFLAKLVAVLVVQDQQGLKPLPHDDEVPGAPYEIMVYKRLSALIAVTIGTTTGLSPQPGNLKEIMKDYFPSPESIIGIKSEPTSFGKLREFLTVSLTGMLRMIKDPPHFEPPEEE